MPIPMLLPSKSSARAWGTLRHGFYDSQTQTIDTGNGEIVADKAEEFIPGGDCFTLRVPGAPGPGMETPENGLLLDYARLYKMSANRLAMAGVGLPTASWLYAARGVIGSRAPEIWLMSLIPPSGWQAQIKAVRFGVFLTEPEEYLIPLGGDYPYGGASFRIDDISEDGSVATFALAPLVSEGGMLLHKVTDAFSIRLSGSGAAMQARAERVDYDKIHKQPETFHDEAEPLMAEIHISMFEYVITPEVVEGGLLITFEYVPAGRDTHFRPVLNENSNVYEIQDAVRREFSDYYVEHYRSLTVTTYYYVDVPVTCIHGGEGAGRYLVNNNYYSIFQAIPVISGVERRRENRFLMLGHVLSGGMPQKIHAVIQTELIKAVSAKIGMVTLGFGEGTYTIEGFSGSEYSNCVTWHEDGGYCITGYQIYHFREDSLLPVMLPVNAVFGSAPGIIRIEEEEVTQYSLALDDGGPVVCCEKVKETMVERSGRIDQLYLTGSGGELVESASVIRVDGEVMPAGFTPVILPFRANNNAFGYVKRTPSGLWARAWSKRLDSDTGWKKLSRDSGDPGEILEYAIEAFAANPDRDIPEFTDHICCYV
ncbi:MAG: hypothetical protein FWH15_06670 [Betaproteobacteria bacterium]|nr:hypothetical protein [Betaproteobacteria bacterium]